MSGKVIVKTTTKNSKWKLNILGLKMRKKSIKWIDKSIERKLRQNTFNMKEQIPKMSKINKIEKLLFFTNEFSKYLNDFFELENFFVDAIVCILFAHRQSAAFSIVELALSICFLKQYIRGNGLCIATKSVHFFCVHYLFCSWYFDLANWMSLNSDSLVIKDNFLLDCRNSPNILEHWNGWNRH